MAVLDRIDEGLFVDFETPFVVVVSHSTLYSVRYLTYVLTQVLHITYQEASLLTTQITQAGESVVASGSFSECEDWLERFLTAGIKASNGMAL